MANTRYAPSPTGDIHLGNCRTGYFNWLAARATGGKFILRIDDTDQDRHNENAVQVIYDVMKWLGLDYDYTFRQSDGLSRYIDVAHWMLANNKAYRADNGAILLKLDNTMPNSWHDTIAGDIAITDKDKSVIDGLVLLKGNSWPTYHFASVVDDIFSKIDWVIRGKDHITNTAKQVAIIHALKDWGSDVVIPKYTHVGLIFHNVLDTNTNKMIKKKMSKRDNAASLLYYRDNGYDPDALLNFMLRMGWGMNDDNLIDKTRAIDVFLTQGKMRNSDAGFDQAKLDSFNKKYKNLKRNVVK